MTRVTQLNVTQVSTTRVFPRSAQWPEPSLMAWGGKKEKILLGPSLCQICWSLFFSLRAATTGRAAGGRGL